MVDETGIFLETERLTLRRFTEDEANLLFDLDSDPEVMRYLTGGRPTTHEEVRNKILPSILTRYKRSEDFGVWAAIEKSSGEFVGWFALDSPQGHEPDNVELGYRLKQSAWGKGYATEGSLALIQKGFTELEARRVFARTMTVNAASRRVMEKCGLRYIRTFFQEWPEYIEGAEHGDVEHAIERDEWERRFFRSGQSIN